MDLQELLALFERHGLSSSFETVPWDKPANMTGTHKRLVTRGRRLFDLWLAVEPQIPWPPVEGVGKVSWPYLKNKDQPRDELDLMNRMLRIWVDAGRPWSPEYVVHGRCEGFVEVATLRFVKLSDEVGLEISRSARNPTKPITVRGASPRLPHTEIGVTIEEPGLVGLARELIETGDDRFEGLIRDWALDHSEAIEDAVRRRKPV